MLFPENERLLHLINFTGKYEMVLVLTQENTFPKRFYVKAKRKNIINMTNIINIVVIFITQFYYLIVFFCSWVKLFSSGNEFLLTILNCWKPLNLVAKFSLLDVARFQICLCCRCYEVVNLHIFSYN